MTFFFFLSFFHDLLTRTILFHVRSCIVLNVVAVYLSSRARSGRDALKCAFGRPRHVIARVRFRVNVESRVQRTAAAPRGRPHASERSVLFSTSVRASISLLTLSIPPEPASHLGQCSMKRCAHFKDGTGEGHRLPAVIKLLENSVPSARGSRLAALSFRCRASG